MPSNAQMFFSYLIELTQMDILPSDKINAWLFNFTDGNPYNEKFDSMGYGSQNYASNLGS
jgi:hypothetical protein